jgi:hypothetical protein
VRPDDSVRPSSPTKTSSSSIPIQKPASETSMAPPSGVLCREDAGHGLE